MRQTGRCVKKSFSLHGDFQRKGLDGREFCMTPGQNDEQTPPGLSSLGVGELFLSGAGERERFLLDMRKKMKSHRVKENFPPENALNFSSFSKKTRNRRA